MGIYNPGIPQNLVNYFVENYKPTYFIETGTHVGTSSIAAAKLFKEVHTIEFSQHFYEIAKNNIAPYNNIKIYQGNSAEKLKEICPQFKSEDFKLFWLDAHWSGGLTYGEGDECPLVEELKTITAYKNSIVMIDDARLFLSPPGLPHDEKQWPMLKDILQAAPDHSLHVFEDVIYLTPESISHNFRKFLQTQSMTLNFFDNLRMKFNRLKIKL